MKDNTTNDQYPKTLVIRNTPEGMIWQIYRVQKRIEAERLAANAHRNGFYGISLEDYMPEYEETWSDWRETEGGKKIIAEEDGPDYIEPEDTFDSAGVHNINGDVGGE